MIQRYMYKHPKWTDHITQLFVGGLYIVYILLDYILLSKACQAIMFYDNFISERSRPLRSNRYQLDESSSSRGIEKTSAGFHHPRCLAVRGIQNHVRV